MLFTAHMLRFLTHGLLKGHGVEIFRRVILYSQIGSAEQADYCVKIALFFLPPLM